MFAISLATGLASHITTILVILHLVEAVSEAFSVYWSHSLGGSFSGSPLDGFWRDGILFVAKRIREKRRCKKRICDVPDHASLLAKKLFLPEHF